MEGILDIVPWFAAGTVMLALAAALLRFGFGRRVNRALALALILHGGMDLTVVVRWWAPDGAAFVARVFPYFWLPLAPAFLYFASLYPERRSWVPSGRWGALPMLALVFALPFLYAVNHQLFDATEPVQGPGGALLQGPGPLEVATYVLHVAYGAIAFLFARAALRAPAGSSRRSSLLLGSVAFALIHLYDAVQYLGDWRGGNPYAGTPLAVLSWTIVASHALALLVYVPLGAVIVRGALRDADRATRRTLRAYALLLSFAASLGAFFIVVRDVPGLGTGQARWIVAGLWDLTFPVVLAYAVLRHQLLDIDVKIRWTVRRGTFAGAFVAVFLVATQVAQNYLSDYGPLVGGVAAGLLLFALTPLHRAAERVAEATVPTKAAGDMTRAERLDAFRSAAVAAWDDGQVDPRERHMLDRLRDGLGLSHEEAARLESEAARSAGPPAAAGPARTAGRARRT